VSLIVWSNGKVGQRADGLDCSTIDCLELETVGFASIQDRSTTAVSNQQISKERGIKTNLTCVLASTFVLVGGVATSNGADYDASSVDWKLDTGMESDRLDSAIEKRRKEGMRVVDMEQYSSGRSIKQAALWVKAMPSDEWETRAQRC